MLAARTYPLLEKEAGNRTGNRNHQARCAAILKHFSPLRAQNTSATPKRETRNGAFYAAGLPCSSTHAGRGFTTAGGFCLISSFPAPAAFNSSEFSSAPARIANELQYSH